jgi:hypothetical protein
LLFPWFDPGTPCIVYSHAVVSTSLVQPASCTSGYHIALWPEICSTHRRMQEAFNNSTHPSRSIHLHMPESAGPRARSSEISRRWLAARLHMYTSLSNFGVENRSKLLGNLPVLQYTFQIVGSQPDLNDAAQVILTRCSPPPALRSQIGSKPSALDAICGGELATVHRCVTQVTL